jgi:hypothetical protein
MQTFILVTLALTALPLVLSFRRRPAPAANLQATANPVPQRISNPRRANRPDVKVWVLHASPACELTREFLHGRRYKAAEAVALPAVGCDRATCGCHYLPVSDTRRRERRLSENRRNAIRFENRSDRRAQNDRRAIDVWQHGSLR